MCYVIVLCGKGKACVELVFYGTKGKQMDCFAWVHEVGSSDNNKGHELAIPRQD